MSPRKHLGRPKDSNSEESHEALLLAARVHFAERGYARASVREIAQAAGYTTSTLYHYFGNKLSLYLAVFRDAERKVASRYREAAMGLPKRQERVHAMLDAAIALHAEDASVPLFLSAVNIECQRQVDIAEAVVNTPIETREIVAAIVRGDDEDEPDPALVNFLSAITAGMVLFVPPGRPEHYAAMLRATQRHLRFD